MHRPRTPFLDTVVAVACVLALSVSGAAYFKAGSSNPAAPVAPSLVALIGTTLEPLNTLTPTGVRERSFAASGRPQLVIAFKSTCPACERTGPIWEEVVRLVRDRSSPFDVVAINTEGDAVARAWLKRHGLDHVELVVPSSAEELVTRWHVPGVPATILLGGDGTVQMAHLGTISPEVERQILAGLQ